MKKFNEFVQEMEQPQQGAQQGVFSKVGTDQGGLNRFMRSMRQMLGSRGVIQGGDERLAARKVLSILRPPIARLVGMGLSADDIMIVIQQVINLVTGMKSSTGLNASRVKSQIAGQINNNQ